MHVNMEFGTVFVDEKVLPFLKDHSCSAGSSCCHRKNVLCEGWDIQRLLQHYIQVSSFAVHQTDFCIASALCHAHTLRAVHRLHAVCLGLEPVIKPLKLCKVCDNVQLPCNRPSGLSRRLQLPPHSF